MHTNKNTHPVLPWISSPPSCSCSACFELLVSLLLVDGRLHQLPTNHPAPKYYFSTTLPPRIVARFSLNYVSAESKYSNSIWPFFTWAKDSCPYSSQIPESLLHLASFPGSLIESNLSIGHQHQVRVLLLNFACRLANKTPPDLDLWFYPHKLFKGRIIAYQKQILFWLLMTMFFFPGWPTFLRRVPFFFSKKIARYST